MWGAWVRISHSGDGCGTHWPDCQGQYWIATDTHIQPSNAMWIEWLHRAGSGVFSLLVLGLVVFAFLKFRIRHSVCRTALCILCLTLSEAMIGAGLVLGNLTGDQISLKRVLVMNGHLLNSLLLASSLFICWRLSLGKQFVKKQFVRWFMGIGFFIIVTFFGSISALASSIFPSHSLWEGIMLDFSTSVNWLIRLRFIHPLLALIVGGGFLYYLLCYTKKTSWIISKTGVYLILCLIVTLLSGGFNLLLLSPVLLKLVHLLCVYLLLMSLILVCEQV